MAFYLFTSSLYLFLFLSPSLAIPSSSSSSSNTDVCSSTPFPDFCKSLLLNNKSASVQDQARFSIHQSFAQTKKYDSSLYDCVVGTQIGTMNVLPTSTFNALLDCQLLLGLNIDLLSNAMQAVNSKYALKLSQIDDQHTKLSAVLTNLETCMDGLLESNSSSISEIATLNPLHRETIKYSISSLALFNKGWVSDKRKRTRLANKKPQKLVMNKGRKVLSFENLKVSYEVTVAQEGSRNFTTINDALAAAPDRWHGGDGYFVIRVMAGVYNEAVYVSKKKNYIMMIGEGINKTIITGHRSVEDEYHSTFSSATFSLFGTGFVGVNLTIRNTAGSIKHQAVALQNSGDKSTFYKCSFEGYQNTLYAHSQRQFYKTCDIYGTIDFMFGAATAVFQNCSIFARTPMKNQFNVITAQGRSHMDQKSGFSIQNCTIALAPDLATDNHTTKMYLGRPWRPYSRTVFMESYIGGLIDPVGWKELDKDSALDTLYYGEFSNYGPGSDTTGRVTWPGYHVINSSDVAVEYTVSRFIFGDEWLPATKVPYNAGLA